MLNANAEGLNEGLHGFLVDDVMAPVSHTVDVSPFESIIALYALCGRTTDAADDRARGSPCSRIAIDCPHRRTARRTNQRPHAAALGGFRAHRSRLARQLLALLGIELYGLRIRIVVRVYRGGPAPVSGATRKYNCADNREGG